MTGLSWTSAALAACLTTLPLAASAEIGASLGVSVGHIDADVDASVDLGGSGGHGGYGSGIDVDASVDLGSSGGYDGHGDHGGSGGVGVGVDVSVGGGTGHPGTMPGMGGGTGHPGTMPGMGGGTGHPGAMPGMGGGTIVAGANGDLNGMMLGNGRPAAALIGVVVWSSDGVMVGVVSGIAGFDGTAVRLAIMANASLGLPSRTVHLAMPMSRLGTHDIRLSITATEFVRIVSA